MDKVHAGAIGLLSLAAIAFIVPMVMIISPLGYSVGSMVRDPWFYGDLLLFIGAVVPLVYSGYRVRPMPSATRTATVVWKHAAWCIGAIALSLAILLGITAGLMLVGAADQGSGMPILEFILVFLLIFLIAASAVAFSLGAPYAWYLRKE